MSTPSYMFAWLQSCNHGDSACLLEQLVSINWHPGESHIEACEPVIQLGRLYGDWRYYMYG